MKLLGNDKALGLDSIPTKVWRYLLNYWRFARKQRSRIEVGLFLSPKRMN